jgi:probable F420-dependent oxidoreductase
MKVGVVFPHSEVRFTRTAIDKYTRAVEDAAVDFVVLGDHVTLSTGDAQGGAPTPHTEVDEYSEVFVLAGYLAAISTLEVMTGVLILPQRQTALVAKQAAQVDVLNGGRLRLGVGLGWNRLDYQALGADFATRADRFGEQIELMRKFWSEPIVTYHGKYHAIESSSLLPQPTRGTIPIWFGTGTNRAALERVGRLGDGWYPLLMPPSDRTPTEAASDWDEVAAGLRVIAEAAEASGRDPAEIGLQGRVEWGDGDVGRIQRHLARWVDAGASYVALGTTRSDLEGINEHIDRMGSLVELARRTGVPAA